MSPFIYAHAAQQRRREQKEESMAGYSAGDLEGWEFKIVRSHFGKFSNQEVVKRVVAEEAQNGWEMLEKFDDHRIRFKRRIEKRALHSGGNIDPYRSTFGANAVVMPLIALAVALVIGLAMFLFNRAGVSNNGPMPFVVFGVIMILAIAMLLVKLRMRS